jgi:hypothetical protein
VALPSLFLFNHDILRTSVLCHLFRQAVHLGPPADADDFPEFERGEYPFDVEWIHLASTKAYLEWIDIAREFGSHPTGKPMKEVFGHTLVPLSLLAVVNH